MAAINSLCPRVLFLDHGKLVRDGESTAVVEEYLTSSGTVHSHAVWSGSYRGDTGEAEMTLKKIAVENSRQEETTAFQDSDAINIIIRYEVHTPLQGARIKVRLTNSRGS